MPSKIFIRQKTRREYCFSFGFRLANVVYADLGDEESICCAALLKAVDASVTLSRKSFNFRYIIKLCQRILGAFS